MGIFPTKVLLATDGSANAQLAAATSVGLANFTGSELHVVYVGPEIGERFELSDTTSVLGPQIVIGRPGPEERARIEQEVQDVLAEQVKEIEDLGGTVTQSHLRMGRPDAEVVSLAEELGAGLIVVGSRGRAGVRRALMGSVSDSVVRHAHCPVMVVRAEKERAAEREADLLT
jgi:nucleotide-binding universal stress UspA family protein